MVLKESQNEDFVIVMYSGELVVLRPQYVWESGIDGVERNSVRMREL